MCQLLGLVIVGLVQVGPDLWVLQGLTAEGEIVEFSVRKKMTEISEVI